MPELPDVETCRRTLEKHPKNKNIQDVKITSSKILNSSRQTVTRALKGEKITGSRRRGAKRRLRDQERVHHRRHPAARQQRIHRRPPDRKKHPRTKKLRA